MLCPKTLAQAYGLRGRNGVVQWQEHEKPRVPAEALRHEWLRNDSGFVHQQLRFDAMDAGRLLQSFNHMR